MAKVSITLKTVSYTHLAVYKRQGFECPEDTWQEESGNDSMMDTPVPIPVSYTHLDVYKRQGKYWIYSHNSGRS